MAVNVRPTQFGCDRPGGCGWLEDSALGTPVERNENGPGECQLAEATTT
jgi:hypothetical protein